MFLEEEKKKMEKEKKVRCCYCRRYHSTVVSFLIEIHEMFAKTFHKEKVNLKMNTHISSQNMHVLGNSSFFKHHSHLNNAQWKEERKNEYENNRITKPENNDIHQLNYAKKNSIKH